MVVCCLGLVRKRIIRNRTIKTIMAKIAYSKMGFLRSSSTEILAWLGLKVCVKLLVFVD